MALAFHVNHSAIQQYMEVYFRNYFDDCHPVVILLSFSTIKYNTIHNTSNYAMACQEGQVYVKIFMS
jgi:hypothetical protein